MTKAETFMLEIKAFKTDDGKDQTTECSIGAMLTSATEMVFVTDQPKITIFTPLDQGNLFAEDFNPLDMGVGGMDDQMMKLFKDVFTMRRLDKNISKQLNQKYVKGVLLFGPPGTGKTLIARQLAKSLKSMPPKIVNGPEVLGKYVGESEANIRNLFADAKNDQEEFKDKSPLHVIIFDEFDAIAKARGMEDSSGVGSNVVNQLLAMIDGVEALDNILLIAMTNRKDLIDDAVLRPGRFEVHIEIGLPDEKGRLQILEIHTAEMKKNGFIDSSMCLNEIAKITPNYTGAELESLTKNAATTAISSQHNLFDFSKNLDVNSDNTKIKSEHFLKACEDIKPAFGSVDESMDKQLKGDFVAHTEYKTLYDELFKQISVLKDSKLPQTTMCLIGEQGVGTTTFACMLAKASKCPYIKLISSKSLLGLSDHAKSGFISSVFYNAYKSQCSVIVLDEIERLIEYVDVCEKFNNSVLQTLFTFIKGRPDHADRRLLVIGTSSRPDVLKKLGLWSSFNQKIKLHPIKDHQEIRWIMSNLLPGVETSTIDLTGIDSVPIKSLCYIASVMQQKISEDSTPDISGLFRHIHAQTQD